MIIGALTFLINRRLDRTLIVNTPLPSPFLRWNPMSNLMAMALTPGLFFSYFRVVAGAGLLIGMLVMLGYVSSQFGH